MKHHRIEPSKKHKKLKSVDPFAKKKTDQYETDAQKKRRDSKEKLKIARLIDQDVPKTFKSMLAYQNNEPKKKKRVKNSKSLLKVLFNLNDGDEIGARRDVKSLPALVEQGPYENELNFFKRLNNIYYKAKTDADIETKFGAELDPQTGEILKINYVRHPRKTEIKKAKLREKNKLRKMKKKCVQKRGAHKKFNDFSHLKDNIKFGEVVSQPPDLNKWKQKFNKFVKIKN